MSVEYPHHTRDLDVDEDNDEDASVSSSPPHEQVEQHVYDALYDAYTVQKQKYAELEQKHASLQREKAFLVSLLLQSDKADRLDSCRVSIRARSGAQRRLYTMLSVHSPFAPEDIARAICCLKDYLNLFISKVEFGPAQGMKLSRAHEKVGADIGNGERLSGQRLKTFEAFKYFKVKYGWTPSRWKGLMLTIMDEIVPDLFARFNKQKVPYIKLGTLSEDTREQKLRRLFANK